MRIEIAGHARGAEFVAVLERDADGGAVLDENLRHLRVGADIDAEVFARFRERLRQGRPCRL